MRPATDGLTIGLARESDLATVRALIIVGLTQRWGDYRHSANPDLEALERTYANASVIVATREWAAARRPQGKVLNSSAQFRPWTAVKIMNLTLVASS